MEYLLYIVENTVLWTNPRISHPFFAEYLACFYFFIVVDITLLETLKHMFWCVHRFSVLWSLSLQGELLGHMLTMCSRTFPPFSIHTSRRGELCRLPSLASSWGCLGWCGSAPDSVRCWSSERELSFPVICLLSYWFVGFTSVSPFTPLENGGGKKERGRTLSG